MSLGEGGAVFIFVRGQAEVLGRPQGAPREAEQDIARSGWQGNAKYLRGRPRAPATEILLKGPVLTGLLAAQKHPSWKWQTPCRVSCSAEVSRKSSAEPDAAV